MEASSKTTDRARKLLAQCRSSEKTIKELLAKRKKPSDPHVVSLRASVRDNYEEILFMDYAFASRKDVELSLWKCAFYKPIEEHRYKIRKLIQAARNMPEGGEHAMARQEASKRFRGFLAEANGFYTGLLRKMQSEFGLDAGGLLDIGGPLSMGRGDTLSTTAHAGVGSWRNRTEAGYSSLHRCLVFLGDIARYREQHRADPPPRGQQHDWSSAFKYYEMAVRLLPTIGNPHNQLAVLATYVDDECAALYRYCRSLCARTPFETARDNMKLLFEKNVQKVHRLGQNRDGRHRQQRQPIEAQLHTIQARFRTRFVRLHGILHTMHGIEGFGDVQTKVMQDLAFLHKGGLLDGALALQLLSINAFSLFQLHTLAPPRTDRQATAGAAAACACAFSLTCATYSMLVNLELKPKEGEDADDEGAGAKSMLGALVVFSEWIARDLLLIVSSETSAFGLPVWGSALSAFSQLLQAPASFDFARRVAGGRGPEEEEAGEEDGARWAVLEQDAELQGFLPFQLSHLRFGQSGRRDMSSTSGGAAAARRAAMVRLRLLAEELAANRELDEQGMPALWFDGTHMHFPAEAGATTAGGDALPNYGQEDSMQLDSAAVHEEEEEDDYMDDEVILFAPKAVRLTAPPTASLQTPAFSFQQPQPQSPRQPQPQQPQPQQPPHQHYYYPQQQRPQPQRPQPQQQQPQQQYGELVPPQSPSYDGPPASNPFSSGFGGFGGFGGLTSLGTSIATETAADAANQETFGGGAAGVGEGSLVDMMGVGQEQLPAGFEHAVPGGGAHAAADQLLAARLGGASSGGGGRMPRLLHQQANPFGSPQ